MGLIVGHAENCAEAHRACFYAKKELPRHQTKITNFTEAIFIILYAYSTTKYGLAHFALGSYVRVMISPEQCRAARAWLGWSQEDLAKSAKVALSTVRDFERGEREPIGHNLDAIANVLERSGIHFDSGTGTLSGIRYNPRVSEKDTYVPILKMLIEQPNGFLKTSDIITALEAWFPLSNEDTEILAGRADTRFSQIVRNVVSHRETRTNLIGAGYAEYDKGKRGLRLTKAGSDWLTEFETREKNGL